MDLHILKENAGVPIFEEKDKIVQCLRANQNDTCFEPKSESIIDERKHFFWLGPSFGLESTGVDTRKTLQEG